MGTFGLYVRVATGDFIWEKWEVNKYVHLASPTFPIFENPCSDAPLWLSSCVVLLACHHFLSAFTHGDPDDKSAILGCVALSMLGMSSGRHHVFCGLEFGSLFFCFLQMRISLSAVTVLLLLGVIGGFLWEESLKEHFILKLFFVSKFHSKHLSHRCSSLFSKPLSLLSFPT